MTKLLLHTCCAPCSTYSVESLREEGLAVTGFWYNPNIHPFTEHQKRLSTIESYAAAVNLPMIYEEGYDIVEYFRQVVGHEVEGERCAFCYRLRLSKTAAKAKENGFPAFATTLLISPYQKHDSLRQVGEELAQENGLEFLYRDLRVGYRQSRTMSKELGLYRQQYCGCVFSEWERYRGAVGKAKGRA